jgi:hypothetical protein
MDELGNFFIQVSSDLSIVDLDVPFGLMFAAGASLNAYSNLGVLAAVTWQVLFVIVPMMVLALRLQVILGIWLDTVLLFYIYIYIYIYIYHIPVNVLCCCLLPRSEIICLKFLITTD